MLIKVIKDSIIYKTSIQKLGSKFECDDAIAKSLIARGYAEAVGVVEEQPLLGFLDPAQLEEMSYQELKKLAADMELSTKGTKAELIERISGGIEVMVEVTENATEDEAGELPNTSMPE